MKNNKIYWIVGLIIVVILLNKYNPGLFVISPCGAGKCNPIYVKSGGRCSSSCGVSDSQLGNIDSCNTQAMVDYYAKYMPTQGVYSDSKCTKPLSEYKCVNKWSCGVWSSCKNCVKTRTCKDLNLCGNEINKPEISKSCGSNLKACSPQKTEITQIHQTFQNTFLSRGLSNSVQPLTKAVGKSISINYKFGRFVPPVSFDNSPEYKLKQPFIQTNTIRLSDYPLGYEMVKLEIKIKVNTCNSFPVNIYWYDGDRLIGGNTVTLNPIWKAIGNICKYDGVLQAAMGHTGKGTCVNGNQFIANPKKYPGYGGYCVTIGNQVGTSNIAVGIQNTAEIEHTGDYSVVIDTLGRMKTINFKVV